MTDINKEEILSIFLKTIFVVKSFRPKNKYQKDGFYFVEENKVLRRRRRKKKERPLVQVRKFFFPLD